MPRPVALIPSGCHRDLASAVSVSSSCFAYAATLATYVHRLDDFGLQRIVAGPKHTCTAVCLSPDGTMVAMATQDDMLKVYDVSTGAEVAGQLAKGIRVKYMAFSLHNPRHVILAANATLQIWDTVNNHVRFVFDCEGSPITSFEQSPVRNALIAIGTESGKVFIMDLEKKLFARPAKMLLGSAIASVAWDLLSPSYILILRKDGNLSMRDVEAKDVQNGSEVAGFSKLPSGQRAIAWAAGMPGTFVCASEKTGVLRMFNVSQPTPIALVKTGLPGISSVKFVGKTTNCLLSSVDGTCGVFDADRQNMLWSTEGGHTETVFRCEFSPTSADTLATCSYDSTVKVWNTRTMKCEKTLIGASGVLYGIAWNGDGNKICTGSGNGTVYVYDNLERGIATASYNIHKGMIFCIAWHPSEQRLIATASADGCACVVKLDDGTMHRSFTYASQSAYGVAWGVHEREHNLLAVALESGTVVVYDVARTVETANSPVSVLRGHTSRAFNVVWHPLVPGRLLSTSDDSTARYFSISAGCLQTLKGHTSHVRAACFHQEVAYIAYTGSWDATIRSWDLRTGACMTVSNEHLADVYGIATHPRRPFTIASCSRDTTVRLWNTTCDVPTIPLCAMFNVPVVADAAEVLASESAPPALSGAVSKEILADAQVAKGVLSLGKSPSVEGVAAIASLMRLFLSPVGFEELFEALASVVAGGKEAADLPVSDASECMHSATVVPVLLSRANIAESKARAIKGRGLAAQSRADAMKQAANMHLMAGNIEGYCNCMAEIGEWDKALLVAPAAGIELWRSLCRRRLAAAREGDAPEDMPDALSQAPLYVAAGQTGSLIDALAGEHRLDEAFLVASAGAHGAFGESATASSARTAAAPAPRDVRLEPLSSAPRPGALPPLGKVSAASGPNPESAEQLTRLSMQQAKRDLERGKPMLAAARCAAANDLAGAISVLYQGCELEAAFVLSLFVGPESRWAALYSDIARRCEHLGLWNLSVELLTASSESRSAKDVPERAAAPSPGVYGDANSLVAARFHGPKADADKLHSDVGAMSPEEARASAESCTSNSEKCRFLALAHDSPAAVAAGLAHLRKVLSQPTWQWEEVSETMQWLGTLDAEKLDKSTADELLCYASYLGGLRAMWVGYPAIVRSLLEQCRRLARQGGFAEPFPVQVSLVSMQELSFVASFDVTEAINGLKAVAAASSTPANLKEACEKRIQHHEAFLAAGGSAAAKRGGSIATSESIAVNHQPVPAASVLGYNGASAQSGAPSADFGAVEETSFISGNRIGASSNRMPVGGSYAVTLSEAFMWARVSDFAVVGAPGKSFVPL